MTFESFCPRSGIRLCVICPWQQILQLAHGLGTPMHARGCSDSTSRGSPRSRGAPAAAMQRAAGGALLRDSSAVKHSPKKQDARRMGVRLRAASAGWGVGGWGGGGGGISKTPPPAPSASLLASVFRLQSPVFSQSLHPPRRASLVPRPSADTRYQIHAVHRFIPARRRRLAVPVFGRAQEPPLSSRWPLLIGTGCNCRRPLRSRTKLPVLSQLEHGVVFCGPRLSLEIWAVTRAGVVSPPLPSISLQLQCVLQSSSAQNLSVLKDK
jgi:hypothetical protein